SRTATTRRAGSPMSCSTSPAIGTTTSNGARRSCCSRSRRPSRDWPASLWSGAGRADPSESGGAGPRSFLGGGAVRAGGDNRQMSDALVAFDDAADRLFATIRRAAAGRLPGLDRLETAPWVGLVVAIVAWVLIVVFSEPWGRA